MIPTVKATRGYRYCGVSATPGCRGLLLLGYSLSKIHENGFGCGEAGNGHGFRFQEVEPMLHERSILGQPTDWFGTVKNSPDLLVRPKLSMCICMCIENNMFMHAN